MFVRCSAKNCRIEGVLDLCICFLVKGSLPFKLLPDVQKREQLGVSSGTIFLGPMNTSHPTKMALAPVNSASQVHDTSVFGGFSSGWSADVSATHKPARHGSSSALAVAALGEVISMVIISTWSFEAAKG